MLCNIHNSITHLLHRNRRTLTGCCITFFWLALCIPVQAQAFLEAEGGIAFTGYNDVRIPADSSDTISLKNDTASLFAPAFRLRAGYTFARRHTLMALYAPLTVRGSTRSDRELRYRDIIVPAGSKVDSIYRFDSWRLTWRYTLMDTGRFKVGLGLTGKVRSADITVMGPDGYASRNDLGVVPLINFRAQVRLAQSFGLVLDGDALWSPYGRAEDVLAAVQYFSPGGTEFRLGYRILEGGSDGGGNVYTFALFHYIVAGITLRF